MAKTVLPKEYNPLLDYDYSYLSKWEDMITVSNTFKPCYSCNKPTDRFNLTLGGYECSKCGMNAN